ncbi:hypothetical protein HF888_04125 [Bermanella marisrubri]|uniref:PilY1 beta-propeller domain-containing protein n=1 Tax=Bermanella marisrubri TaxID=207949 RepID=Q1MYS1_9GAMM|nr:PilC/PilY family type IV pilus protein [Bermanella marisrubri]EAT11135.1 hypothetical protein RED65_05054 [Oceanobacter sp. RED65] [Bermanella marisrubri]QIZ83459.1 hypothetical protein HF888_04125 [Bermanella marisrubri]
MKFIFLLLISIFFCTSALSDDTEIYGAAAIDEANRVDPNVLFIVDTSGSMDFDAVYFDQPYDPSVTYPGNYSTNRFYIDENQDPNEGFDLSLLQTSRSNNCETTIEQLAETGKISGIKYYQIRQQYKWWQGKFSGPEGYRDLHRLSDGDITCDGAYEHRLFSGNYLNFYHDDTNTTITTRMAAVKSIVSDLTRDLKNVNLGLMRFDGAYQASNGGAITVPVDDIDNTGALIRNSVDSFEPYWGTPLSETLYEAHLYFAGKSVKFGDDTSPESSDAAIDEESKYISPIQQQCQKNHIIYLTDGVPSVDVDVNADIKKMIASLGANTGLSSDCKNHGIVADNENDESGICLDELAYYMANVDHSDKHAGIQVVNTHVINAFGDIEDEDSTFLKDTAKLGGGGYYRAENPLGVASAINSIVAEILSSDSTFTAPAISVNAFNNSEHRDELFYALFKPQDNAKWDGNLKKYRLGKDGKIYDKYKQIAIDPSTGFFSKSSRDFWNTAPKDSDEDGKNVTLGGIANLIDPANRKIYTNNVNDALDTFRNEASATSLGVLSNQVDTLKNWVYGYEQGSTSNSPRYYIGDPLHSEPVVVTYGGTEKEPDSTIYFGTNEGFIHAIDTDTGQEEFAFIPRELHDTQITLFENTVDAGNRPYGMDGPITTWMYDLNSNNVIYDDNGALEAGEHAYLYAGMRRGGRNYYALNVTDRSNPKMLFNIEGGTTNFERLGQTWSEMTIAKVKFEGKDRFVAFFAGGYDTNQDTTDTTRTNDTTGNAIYMVDARKGTRLWWASRDTNTDNDDGAGTPNLVISEMKNSIPASVSAVDINGDGYVDYLYAADTGGRVFRIDIKQDNSGASDFAEGGVIAELSDNTKAGNRRFYNKPSVAIVKDKDYGDYLTIALGSGHRAHPILTKDVENRFYVIKDFYPYGKPKTYVKTTEAAETKTSLAKLADGTSEAPSKSKVYNATALMTGGKTKLTNDMRRIMAEGGGWYVKLNTTGEKSLSQATTFAGAVIFTTFAPKDTTNASPCEPNTGVSRVYALDQRWAMAAVDLDNDGDVDVDDSNKILTNSGIAPRPVVIYRKGGGKSITLGTESIDDSRFKESSTEQCNANNCYVTPNYWRENVKVYEAQEDTEETTGG